ncbi:hypothetical protein [Xanthomonas graminis]|uniref:hypothetical protein n=1 Tax=Xanthomonas graminis TaxID=3390026 RepID=UPI00163EF0C3|nr:hypothetical protein [Xanthomonas translucens]
MDAVVAGTEDTSAARRGVIAIAQDPCPILQSRRRAAIAQAPTMPWPTFAQSQCRVPSRVGGAIQIAGVRGRSWVPPETSCRGIGRRMNACGNGCATALTASSRCSCAASSCSSSAPRLSSSCAGSRVDDRDRAAARPLQQPGQRHLRRRMADVRGDLLDRVGDVQRALGQHLP